MRPARPVIKEWTPTYNTQAPAKDPCSVGHLTAPTNHDVCRLRHARLSVDEEERTKLLLLLGELSPPSSRQRVVVLPGFDLVLIPELEDRIPEFLLGELFLRKSPVEQDPLERSRAEGVDDLASRVRRQVVGDHPNGQILQLIETHTVPPETR